MRIGILLPSSNITIEPEFYRILPSEITVHASRLPLTQVNYGAWMVMNKEIEKASSYLADADVGVILFACTGASFAKPGYDAEIIERIKAHTGITATTTSTSIIEALRQLRLTKIALGTPYPDEVNQIGIKFLESHGISVIAQKGLGITSSLSIGKLKPTICYSLAADIDRTDVEGFFLSCTNLRTIEVLDQLEERVGRPVLSSNQVSLWNALRLLGYREPIRGFGRILSGHAGE